MFSDPFTALLLTRRRAQPVITYGENRAVGHYDLADSDGLKLYTEWQMNYRSRALSNPGVTENSVLKDGAVFRYAAKPSTTRGVKQCVLTWQPVASITASLERSGDGLKFVLITSGLFFFFLIVSFFLLPV